MQVLGIRYIQNNLLRRLLMVVLFVPVICFVIAFNFLTHALHFLKGTVRSFGVLGKSVKQFWKEAAKRPLEKR